MIVIDYFIGVFYITNWGSLNFKTRENVIERIKEVKPECVEIEHKGHYLRVTGDFLPTRITCIASQYKVLLG